jgi:hypothetical protein
MAGLVHHLPYAARRLAALAVLSGLSLLGCTKECDKCTTDADCEKSQETPVCRNFSNGDRRCGSGLGATTCRIP